MNPTDMMIMVIVVIAVAFGGYRLWLQMSGRKTCCGCTKEKIKSKKLKHSIGTKTVYIEGMHCDNCKNSVTKALNGLEGVSGKVDLGKKIAIVSFEREVADGEITEAIESKGFAVSKIESN
ncbi:heavy metal-associated domain-containing protein [Chakrabartyella piscis]|uniref:heavy-metal-associated domain-containing protein n=1 Tax=Chakrabartyella piscis TaxID=2918914 RepID=UPI002958D2D0|nr:heavy metal-associated domain-containing protein [Chakrabartyella piscis]